jgi:hypothetical protein
MMHLLHRFRTSIFFLFMGVSGGFLMTIESTFNGGFYYSVKLLCIPLAIIILAYVRWHQSAFGKSRRIWIVAGLLYPIALLMSWPYVMALNLLTSPDKKITYHGTIERKWESNGRTVSYHVDLLDTTTRQLVTLNYSPAHYAQVARGDTISETYFAGRLGIPARWKYANPLAPEIREN